MASRPIDSPGNAANSSGRPPSILLAQHAYVTASRNETTAATKSRCGRTVEVTFWIADPPAVSFCTFHCSRPPFSDSEDADLEVRPHVLAAEGPFVLLRTRFASGDDEYEYFVYKADVKSPSLECIPLPEDIRILDGVHDFGVLPIGGDGYLLAGFYDTFTSMDYGLTIYSSEDKSWRTETMRNPCPSAGFILPEKPPAARYIPLPAPLPENIRKLRVYNPGATPRRFRDLTCSDDGVIKFIEMEHRVLTRETREFVLDKPEDPTQKGLLYDSDLIWQQTQKGGVETKPKSRVYSVNAGWRAATWTRAIDSDCWRIGRSIDVDDILVDDSFTAMMSAQSDESLRNLSFKNLDSAWPILSPDGDDLLYLKTTPKFRFSDRWVPDSCESENKRPRLSGEKVDLAQNGAQNVIQNPHIFRVAEPNSCESENKHRIRLSAGKVNLAQNGAQSVVQNVHIPSPLPVQNSQVYYPGRSGGSHHC
ncbi:hypothetical protein QOZ80_3BG0292270 [Eleusine coracana subsp. coracana]|nr:hypothetical protein QOZ80_3BG0292270 [Eleusine coracana subsp. coracana]